jgi:hypothetical protein
MLAVRDGREAPNKVDRVRSEALARPVRCFASRRLIPFLRWLFIN